MEKLIKDIYKDTCEISGSELSSLELWYNELLKKSIRELSILDISHMLRQNVLLPLALSKAMERLIKNPMDGDLLKQVVNAMKNHGVAVEKQAAEEFIIITNIEKNAYEWKFEEDKAEYEELLDDFIKMAGSPHK